MSLKDVIFVALIVLSGLICYLHGVDAGIRRTRRLFERYLSNPKAYTELPPSDGEAKGAGTRMNLRGRGAPKPVIQGIFGKN